MLFPNLRLILAAALRKRYTALIAETCSNVVLLSRVFRGVLELRIIDEDVTTIDARARAHVYGCVCVCGCGWVHVLKDNEHTICCSVHTGILKLFSSSQRREDDSFQPQTLYEILNDRVTDVICNAIREGISLFRSQQQCAG